MYLYTEVLRRFVNLLHVQHANIFSMAISLIFKIFCVGIHAKKGRVRREMFC